MRVTLVRDNVKRYGKEQILLATSLILKNPGKRGGGFQNAMKDLGASDSGLSRFVLKSGKLIAVGERLLDEKNQWNI